MKQSDIFSLILIASIGTLAAFFVCQAVMGDPDESTVTFKKLKAPISSQLIAPDAEVFSSTAINPTIEVFVGDCEDIDRNGILDAGELYACGRIQRDPRSCEDTDGDGVLNADELKVCEIDLDGAYIGCDTDGDGTLSRDEQTVCMINVPEE